MFFDRRKGHRYVDRGDPSAHDFTLGDFITDGSWHNLDLSGICPVGTKAVLLKIELDAGATNNFGYFRKLGNVNYITTFYVQTVLAVSNYSQILIPCDNDRFIEYAFTSMSWTTIVVSVLGWWV